MLVKNTQEISKYIENSNMPPEIKDLLLAKVLDESIPSLLPETRLDLDNRPHYDEHQWNVLKNNYKSDFIVGQERVIGLFDTAEKTKTPDDLADLADIRRRGSHRVPHILGRRSLT